MRSIAALRHARRTRLCLALAASALCAGAAAQGLPAPDASAPAAEAILEAAFANRYEVDLTSNIDLVMRNRMGQELRRRFRAASKRIDGRVHSVGRLVWPEYLRGMTILTIEAENRSHDSFLYLPSLGKVRRVTTAQRHDSFLGSDVTYEDLERRRVADYELAAPETGEWDGERVYVIRGTSRRDFDYSHLVFFVARSDGAILETQYFKRGQDAPYRVIRAPREAMLESDGHVLPTQLDVENRARGTTTQVLFRDLEINPPIDDHLFSVSTLEQQRKLAVETPDQTADGPAEGRSPD
jgi:hypothetical protein